MADSQPQKTGRQKAVRFAVVPLLVVVLLVVCLWPDEQADIPAIESSDDLAQATAEQTGEQFGGTSLFGGLDRLAKKRTRQRMELSRILEHDPFALPAEVGNELSVASTQDEQTEDQAAAQERERIATIVESLQREKLNVLYRDKQGVSAILGKRVLHEGDEIEAGVRILKITQHGLTLEVSAESATETSVD